MNNNNNNNNKLNNFFDLPKFSSIQIDHITKIIQKKITHCYNTVDKIISNTQNITWNNLYHPLMIAENELNKIWSPLAHINSVNHNPKLRFAYKKNLLSILTYKNWIAHHHGLYKSYKKLRNNHDNYRLLNTIQKSALNKTLLNYTLSGINLSCHKKKQYQYIISQLSQVSIDYSNNVLDATSHWKKIITNKKLLSGIPHDQLTSAKLAALNHGQKQGWLFTLQHASYESILLHCNNSELRKEFYWAFNTRASDQGPHGGKWDNTMIINEILALRHELAQLLGFNNYFEKSLKTKMVQYPKHVFNFLINLYNHINKHAYKEFIEIQHFAQKYHSNSFLNPWDIAYYKEQQKKHLFPIIQQEKLNHYFPIDQVLNGIFTIAKNMYNIFIKQRNNIDAWNPNVQFFDVFDEYSQWKGGFYLDLYHRHNKHEGAWIDIYTDMMSHKLNTQENQKPIVYLICNFNPPIHAKKPCLLTHDNIITLFHEFGHALHHILTSINIPSISGIHGVPEDFVEVPSQFMEKLCWEPNALKLISMHYATKHALPNYIISNLVKLKTYQQSPLKLLKQIIYGLFDFKIHYQYTPKQNIQISKIFNAITQKISPYYPILHTDRFPHSFIHLFATENYAAGYYSYLWSDMIASYIWQNLNKSNILNIKTGKMLLDTIWHASVSNNLKQYFYTTFNKKITTKYILKHYNIPLYNNIFFKLH